MRPPNPYADLPRDAIRCTCGAPIGDSLMQCTVCRAPICLACGLSEAGSVCRGPHAGEAFTIDPRFLN